MIGTSQCNFCEVHNGHYILFCQMCEVEKGNVCPKCGVAAPKRNIFATQSLFQEMLSWKTVQTRINSMSWKIHCTKPSGRLLNGERIISVKGNGKKPCRKRLRQFWTVGILMHQKLPQKRFSAEKTMKRMKKSLNN